MSAQVFTEPPVPADLPDWLLALKPPEADLAQPPAEESVVFFGLDAELEALGRSNPQDIEWLAEIAAQPTPLISHAQAESILDGAAKPDTLMRPHRKRRKRIGRLRQEETILLDAMLALMILAVLALWLVMRFLAR
jgi:hypothetical protein